MEEISRLVLLLLAASAVLAVVKYGPGGLGVLWRSKFLGQPTH